MKSREKTFKGRTDKISSYFAQEKIPLFIVTVTGILYNIGLIAGPWFEGQLAQTLCDIITGEKTVRDMIFLAVFYVVIILAVQLTRCAKRFYVRRFANNVSRNMKRTLCRNLLHQSKAKLSDENVGSMMTKAISDVDTCAEGMRKFTTEIFDTGVVMIAYFVMLSYYDWRLALLSCVFVPFAYILADQMKKKVSRYANEQKESAGRLNGATLDRIAGTLTYRILGEEESRDQMYEKNLSDYEEKSVRAQVYETTLQPIYRLITAAGVIVIVWIGAKNVMGTGFCSWNIASFTVFLSCFTKLAAKCSKAAKLFNSVQKAKVSWTRIQPMMQDIEDDLPIQLQEPADLSVENLSFAYTNGKQILSGISFSAKPGEIIGITGEIGCGKSTLGKAFLSELPYDGVIRFGGRSLLDYSKEEKCGMIAYMGHDPELLDGTIQDNVLMGDNADIRIYLKAVLMDEEINQMAEGIETKIRNGGIRLSGGQQARIALARTLCHKRPLIILDDPFSALDRDTEKRILHNIRKISKDAVILLFSHRLFLFPETDKVLWMDHGHGAESTHEALMQCCPAYSALYRMQTENGEERRSPYEA